MLIIIGIAVFNLYSFKQTTEENVVKADSINSEDGIESKKKSIFEDKKSDIYRKRSQYMKSTIIME